MTIEFGTWESPETVNPYIDTINALAAHIKETGNENASVTITVPKGEAIKTRLNVSRAANAIDKTARVRVNGETVIENGTDTGNVRFVFTLTKKHKARKGSEHVATETETPDEETETPATPATPAPKPGKRA